MAKVREYLVSFTPAEKTDRGFTMEVGLMTRGQKHEIEASNFVDLERDVRRLACEFGQSCTPYVRLKNSRERHPIGFDKWNDSNAMRFIEFVPAA